MALSLVGSLSKIHPEYTLEYLIDYECRSLVLHHPNIKHVHCMQRSNIQRCAELGNFAEAYHILQRSICGMLENTYYLSLNLFQENYSAILQTLIRATYKKGKFFGGYGEYRIPDMWSKYLYAIPANRAANPLHAIDIYHRIAGITQYERPIVTLPFSEPAESVQQELKNRLPYVVMQPGSAWPGKKWPLEHWIEFIELFLEARTESIVITGAPEECSEAQSLAAIAPGRILNLAGKTNLLDTSYILKNARMLICGDTFAMHMATAVACPVFALFGPSNPIETGPYGSHHVVIQSENGALCDFNFNASPHIALEIISPRQLIGVITQTSVTQLHISETFWNPQLSYQFLVDVTSGSNTLKKDITVVPDLDLLPKTIILEKLRLIESHLSRCQNISLSQKESSYLAQLDSELYQSTDKNISFEYYRITLNSISISSINIYLDQRLQLTQEYITLLSS